MVHASACLQIRGSPVGPGDVLEGHKGPSFALLQGVDLQFVSHRAVLLLALASAKRVSDCVLLILLWCAVFLKR